jgi:hypothetical protein
VDAQNQQQQEQQRDKSIDPAGAAIFSPKQRILLKNFPACGNSRKRKHNKPGRITKQMGNGKTQQQQLQQQQCQVPREFHTHATLQTDSSTEFS